MIDWHQAAAKRHHQAVSAEEFPHKQLLSCAYVDQKKVGGTCQFSQSQTQPTSMTSQPASNICIE